MSTISVWLPFPPSVNNLFTQGMVKGKIRRFPSKKYKSWRKEALLLIKVARVKRITAPVSVRLLLTQPTSARRDVDNYSKAVLDALVAAGALDDDSQVVRLTSVWADAAQPGVTVEIGPPNAEWPEIKARPPLLKSERNELERLKRGGCRLVTPQQRKSRALNALVVKGYVREHPGLIADAPQAFEAID